LFISSLKLTFASLCVLFLTLAISVPVAAQTVPGQPAKIPQPGEFGSAFKVDHFWNHFAFEISGGYSPVVNHGAGYFDKGWDVTIGAIDRLSPRWKLLTELQYFGMNKNTLFKGQVNPSNPNIVATLGLSTAFDLLSHTSTSPYLIGGGGYYRLVPQPGANAAGGNIGVGIRHRIYADRQVEIFAEARYHYIASGSTAFGQISLFPITAGFRW
jgi:hypothetical protein